jgi:CHAT domain-containing protein
MTGIELAATFRNWQETYGNAAPFDNLAQAALQQGDAHPYADPLHWAPFMLIGRPT